MTNDLPGDDTFDASGLASVVRVDRQEDVAAICGRVDGAPTFAVVIHAPQGNRPLSTELGMRRLLRHAGDTGRTVAIATSNTALASRARQVGVPVARRPDHVRWDSAGKRVVHVFGRSFVPPALGNYLLFAIVIIFAGVFGALAVTLAPAATITVFPPTELVTEVVTIAASENFDDVDVEALEVPATRVTAGQTITLAVRTTGRAQVATIPARAVVSMTNTSPAAVTVAAGSALLGPQRRIFELDADTSIPAGATVSQSATAILPGPAGNVAAGTIIAWQDAALNAITVTNQVAASGGATEERPAVAPADIIELRALARDLATSDEVKRSLITARPRDAIFLRTAETEITQGNPSLAAGAPGDLVLMEVKVSVSALAVVAEDLDRLARGVLASQHTDSELLPGSVSAVETGARRVDTGSGVIRTDISIAGEFTRQVTRNGVRAAVKGKSTSAAREELARLYRVEDADVRLSPGWAPRIPRFDFRIDVELKRREPTTPTPAESSPSNDPTPAASSSPRTGS